MASFSVAAACFAVERTESFDVDPKWDSSNNRTTAREPQLVSQEFRYRNTHNAGGARAGEIGGLLTPAAEPAYYAKRIEPRSFDDRLSASGQFACTDRHFHVLVGFFNASTVNEWRVPNSIVLRLYGRGDVFYAYLEYATSRWRAGGDNPGGFATITDLQTGKSQFKGFASDKVHRWSLEYDPEGNGGNGHVVATIDGERAVCNLDPGHKQDGATFNRLGMLNIPKHFDQGGQVWLDDVTINGDTENFDRDPAWEAVGTPRTYTTYSVRPRFDFGYSATHFSGGKQAGEMGGEIFRGDAKSAETIAYYGDRLERLTLKNPLRAGGKVAMRRGVSDSTVLIGFFNSKESAAVSVSASSGFPKSFLGVAIEGPSREGFYFYPACHFANGTMRYATDPEPPHIMPNAESHDWTFEYMPHDNGSGLITVTLDEQQVSLQLERDALDPTTQFDRFGIVTTWIDGNSQIVYFDDLTYTFKQ